MNTNNNTAYTLQHLDALAAAMTSTLPPGSCVGGGRYRIERVLGEGTMGVVYEATQEAFQRPVALKVIRPELVDDRARLRFKVEALATSQLSHPNVVSLYDFGVDDDVFFLALERLDGITLQDEIEARGAMPWPRAVVVLQQIAAAVATAHAAAVIHRDLKPTNIFLCEGPGIRDFVKVLDFGIAKILRDNAPKVSTTKGIVLGTPGYVAPERLRGGDDEPASDLYAIGCIAWSLLAGRAPFTAKNPMQLLLRHLSDPAPRLKDVVDVPPALDGLVASLLEKEPAMRPTAARLLSSLRALLP